MKWTVRWGRKFDGLTHEHLDLLHDRQIKLSFQMPSARGVVSYPMRLALQNLSLLPPCLAGSHTMFVLVVADHVSVETTM